MLGQRTLKNSIRAQGVGLYWGIRGVAICWASLAGAVIWDWLGPEALLYIACGFGCAGAGVFYLWVRDPSLAHAEREATIEG